MKRLRGLYAITPELADRDRLLDLVRAALDGGITALQYRCKDLEPSLKLEEVKRYARLCRAKGIPLIVNDDLELAAAGGADGVHLGRDDGDLGAARARLPGKILGASCYDRPELARAAAAAGADYVAFGSVFPSPTKPGAVRAPLSLFAQDLGIPLCAIGGITLENAPQLLRAGADLLAVITDLFDAPDVRARAGRYRRLFDEQPEAV